MIRKPLLFGAALALALPSAPALAQVGALRLTPGEIADMAKEDGVAGTFGVTGIRSTILSGDPAKAGLYTIAVRIPANTRLPAHRHRDERTTVVVSGLWYVGYGATASDDAAKPLPPGGFYTEPRGVAHFGRTGGQAAVIYVTGFGPTDTTYVNPPEGPRP